MDIDKVGDALDFAKRELLRLFQDKKTKVIIMPFWTGNPDHRHLAWRYYKKFFGEFSIFLYNQMFRDDVKYITKIKGQLEKGDECYLFLDISNGIRPNSPHREDQFYIRWNRIIELLESKKCKGLFVYQHNTRKNTIKDFIEQREYLIGKGVSKAWGYIFGSAGVFFIPTINDADTNYRETIKKLKSSSFFISERFVEITDDEYIFSDGILR